MKFNFSFLLLISICSFTYSQETRSVTYSERITNVYNKSTGEKLSNKTLQMLMKEHPGITFEKVFNKYGEIEKYLYNPDSIVIGVGVTRTLEKQTKPGHQFPPFAFTTIDDKLLDSEQLRGSWVLIRFELFVKMSNLEDIEQLNEQIKEIGSDQKIVPIISFVDSQKTVEESFDSGKYQFEVVGDNRSFQEMFNIISLPTTILLDPEGVVVDYFNKGDKLILRDLLEN